MTELSLLYQTADSYGPIMVFEDSDYRVLAFANNDEQSRCLKAAPQQLQYAYTQAMLLVLLFNEPKRVLLLGLGGGSLVTALHAYAPAIDITAVELRASVIEIATRFFYLPRSKRIHILHQEANDFIQTYTGRTFDLIFSDLYHAEGAAAVQSQAEFLVACAQQLKSNGWLVINVWSDQRQQPDLMDALKTHFSCVYSISTTSKNWILIAGQQTPYFSQRELKEKSQQLSHRLGFSLGGALQQMREI